MKFRLLPLLALVAALAGCQKDRPALPGAAEPIKVSVSVDHPTVRIGDLVRYTITADAVTNLDVVMPQFGENLGSLQNMLIHDWETLPEEPLPGGRVLRRQVYELETYLTGLYEIPPARVRFISGGATNDLYTSAVCVEIASMTKEGDMEDIRDVKDVVELGLDSGRTRTLVLVLAALAAVAAVCLLCFRKRREKNAPPPPPAHEVAFAALLALEKDGLLERGLFKEYLFRLTMILRTYIENRFEIRAPEQTTEEFLQVLRQSPAFTYQQREMLRSFLTECDMIKFANQEASQEICEGARGNVASFVEESKQAEEPVSGAAKGEEK